MIARKGKNLVLVLIIAVLSLFCKISFAIETAQSDSDQQINDFSLAGYGERGKKTWDIAGKSADIFTETIKLKDLTGNLYGEKDNVKLTANSGDFDKAEGKVHLEQDVVITTSSGAKLTTDSLDWDRKNDIVATKDHVHIIKDNTITTALGAIGHPSLNKVDLQKDVKLEITPDEQRKNEKDAASEKVVITCDGPLSIDYDKNVATFSNNVLVNRPDSQIYSDKMDVYFSKNDQGSGEKQEGSAAFNSKITTIVARGNVKIVRGENVSYSDEATYDAVDKKIVLSGKPKLIVYSTEGMNASFGN